MSTEPTTPVTLGQLAEATARDTTRTNALLAMTYRGNLPSPCISVCKMDAASGLCQGCFRTIDEIRLWAGLGDAGKRRVWQLIRERVEAPA